MKKQIVINKLIPRTFNLVKVNQVLIMPFLMFLLLLVMVLSPIGGINPFILVAIIALKSVFLAGWLNMFHMCLENTKDDNISDEQKTLNSLNLYKEFFPGVGKYYWNVFTGIGLYLIAILIIIVLAESIAHYFVGDIKSLAAYTNQTFYSFNSRADLIDFWNKIAHTDKIKIEIVLAFDLFCIGLFSFLTMFWAQSIVVEEKSPINAFASSIKTVLNDSINTFLIFVFMIISFIFVFGLNFILGENILSQLLALMLFAHVIVYYTMMTFLYFERYR